MTTNKSDSPGAATGLTRRQMLRNAAVAGAAFTIVPRSVLGANGDTPPSEKVQIAIIGTGGQGIVNMRQLLPESSARIVALCDLNPISDYSMFYYGGTAGLQPALDVVREAYGEPCATYRDYHEMLDSQDIDAVLLATPDHSHGMIALDVIAKKKHLYCEKPLCRTIHETRVVTEAARQAGVATQMGNFGHSSEDIRLLVEWIQDGAIGDVTEVHAWTNTGADRWTPLKDRPSETPPVPEGFDWERWLRPVPARPYHPDYAPVRWRAWWEFGSGTIGDFASHHLDPAFWALKLDACDRFHVEASAVGHTAEVCPAASLIHFHFPARAGMAPVRISWYEGGVMPPRPAGLELDRGFETNGVMYVGTKGAIIGGGWSRSPRIVPESQMQAYQRPPKTLARVSGHHTDWLEACRSGGQYQASDNFDYAGPLNEFSLMGNVAIRAGVGKILDFDWKNLKVLNDEDANAFLKPVLAEGMTI